MGRAIEMGQREQLITLKQQGQSLETIAQQLNLSLSTVRQLSARFKQQGHLKVTYANCGPKQALSEPLLQRASLWLKRHHPQWGAPLDSNCSNAMVPNEPHRCEPYNDGLSINT